jgi:hypothetical protein
LAYPNITRIGDVVASGHLADFTTGTPSVYLAAPQAGRIIYATAVPQGNSTGSSTLTMKVNGAAITNGTLALSTTAGTATALDLHGLLDHTNDVSENFTSDGASTDGTVAANVQVVIRPTRV